MRHRLMHQSPSLTLEYDMLDEFLHAQWGPDQTVDTIREGYEQILTTLQQTFCHRLLDNQQQAQGNWSELADWFAADWYPRAQRAGLQAYTLVFSSDFFGRRSSELALEHVAGGLVAGFDAQEPALHALLHL